MLSSLKRKVIKPLIVESICIFPLEKVTTPFLVPTKNVLSFLAAVQYRLISGGNANSEIFFMLLFFKSILPILILPARMGVYIYTNPEDCELIKTEPGLKEV